MTTEKKAEVRTPMMSCGCVGMALHGNEHDGLLKNHPCCIIHDCCSVADEPNLDGRMARCTYYGETVKTGMYNGNCCEKCKGGGLCSCERPSSLKLWFFKHKPDEEYDEFYCACHGAD